MVDVICEIIEHCLYYTKRWFAFCRLQTFSTVSDHIQTADTLAFLPPVYITPGAWHWQNDRRWVLNLFVGSDAYS